jgi:putative oxidoreductase
LRRLFSSFADGWPGVGLLGLRLVAGMVLIARGVAILRTGAPLDAASAEIVAMIAALLLIAGMWTPVSGSALALVQMWNLLMRRGDPWTNILLGTLGAALALLGPGAWSIDARRFGWKRMDIREKNPSSH